MKTSCIDHPKNERLIIIRQWQVEACDGNTTEAALLSFFEYWHNIKLEMSSKNRVSNDISEIHGDTRNQDESLLQFHTEEELEQGIMIASRKTIRNAIARLEKRGFISVQRNPNPRYRFDKTKYFLFHADKLNTYLSERKSNSAALNGKIAARNGEVASQNGRSSSAITETTPEITNQDFPHTLQQQHNATLDAAAAEREGGGNEFEESQEVDTPHIVNSKEFVANGKSNQVDHNSAAAPCEVVMSSHLEAAAKYLKAIGIRGNKTLNQAIAAKAMDEVVMALGFLLEKELDNYQNGKEPIRNKAGFFKKALEDDSAIDWLEMMDYTELGKETWRWGIEARLKGFTRGAFLDTNSFVIDDQISLNLDECFNCWKTYGWDEFERVLNNSIKKIRQAA